MHYYRFGQTVETVNLTDFNGTYTLGNLRPYTVYSVYVTVVKRRGNTGGPLEGMKSKTLTERTLAGGGYMHICTGLL